MTQVHPLVIVAYRIGFLPLIKRLKSNYPDITQPWYANNAGALGMFDNLEQYFDLLKRNVPAWGYHPKPIKSILTVNPNNLEARYLFGRCHGFKVCMGANDLGGYIGDA